MTTITIFEEDIFDKTEFKNISELLDYLSIRKAEQDFSDQFIEEMNNRENDLISGKVEAKSWSSIKNKL
jgi:hypothetical protein